MTFTRQPTEGLCLDVLATLEDVREAVRAVSTWLADQKLSSDECREWELVLAEAANNAVIHTPPSHAGKPIRIEASASTVSIEIRITDRTPGFDWPEHVELPEDVENEHGRGLFIIRSLTDESYYMRGADRNVLTLRRGRKTVLSVREDPNTTLDLMTAEVASCYETLANIFRLSAEAARDVDPSTLASNWIEELRQIAGADFLTLRMAAADSTQPQFTVWAPPTPGSMPAIDLGSSKFTESCAYKTRQDQWFDSTTLFHADDPLAARGSTISGLAHPLETGGEVVGVLTLGVLQPQWEPKARELNVVRSLGDFLGSLLHSLRRRDEANQARLIKRELQIAADIQRSLLPDELPQTACIQSAGHLTTAGEVGGDFLDGIALADGSLLFVIADVMGKGVPAALFATMFRSLLHSHLELASSPSALMRRLNASLFSELDRAEMFITVQLVHLSADGFFLRTSSAGHSPLLLCDGKHIEEICADGPPIGVSSEAAYEHHEITLSANTHILLHTDGLSDVFADSGSLSHETLHQWLLKAATDSMDAWSARDSLRDLHRQAHDSGSLQDDATFLILTRGPSVLPSSKPNTLTHASR